MIESKYLNEIFKASIVPSLLIKINKPYFTILSASNSYLAVTNKTEKDLIGNSIFEIFPAIEGTNNVGNFDELTQSLYKVLESKLPDQMLNHRYDFPKINSTELSLRYWNIINTPIFDENNNLSFIIHSAIDVTNNRYLGLMEKLEKEILEMNALNTFTLNQVISKYMLGIESLHPGMICSMQKLVGTKLYNLASPSLPLDYIEFTYGMEIGQNAGSCGTAAFLKENVFVSDIQNDIRWVKFKEITKKNNLNACWSHPIISSNGKVKATFACYSISVKSPVEIEISTIKRAGNILKIILENSDQSRAIKQSEEQFRLLINDMQVGVILQNENAEILVSNPKALELLGLTLDQLLGKTNFDESWNVIHEDGSPFPANTHPVPQAIALRQPVKDVIMGVYRPATDDRVWLLVNAFPEIENGILNHVVCTFNDITKKKLAEEEIILSNERYELVGKATSDSIWDWNLITDEVKRLGDGFETLFGYDAKITNNDNQFWQKIVHPDDLPRVKNSILKVLENAEEHNWVEEFRIKKANGDYSYVKDKGYIIRDENGKAIRMIGATQDINTIKKSAFELVDNIKALEVYKFALNQSAIIGMTDDKGIILNVNENFCNISGYSAAELIGKTHVTVNSRFHNDAFFKEMWETIASGKVWKGDIKNKKKSGDYYWASATIIPFLDKDKKPFQYLAVRFDITERKKAEEALIDSNDRYNLVAKATNDSIWDWDLVTGKIKRTGEGFKVLFGYDSEHENNNWKELVHKEDIERVQNSLDTSFNNKNISYWEQDYRILKANGKYAFVNDKGYIIRDKNGRAIRMIGATQDITERVMHLNAIETQNKKLRQIAWDQSHIVRAPLSRMMAIVSMLKEMDITSDEFKEWIKHFETSGEELDNVIREITNKSAEINLEF
jgi:PAS domain S-box-containing protein